MSLGHFWAYVGQPHGHIDWAKSMPFASINSTNPRTHPAQFGKKILRIDRLAKWGFFESAILDFFFSKKKIFFCLIPWKIVKGSWIARMGQNFDDYPGFQPFRSWANTYAQDCIWYLGHPALKLTSRITDASVAPGKKLVHNR